MTSISRRNLFKYSAGAVGGSIAAVALEQRAWGVGEASTKAVSTPDLAVNALYQGNKRFSLQKTQQPNRGSFRLREVAKGQKPFAAILGCADSRVPTEIIFDQGLGDLFVVRVAGNIATAEEIGSLEFGTLVLGAKVIMVLGHGRCGAVDAAIQGNLVPGKIGSILDKIKPAVNATAGQTGDRLMKTTIANVKNQMAELQSSPVIADLVKAGKLKIVGGVYDLDTGVVTSVA
jgi:carbonic anhydrase